MTPASLKRFYSIIERLFLLLFFSFSLSFFLFHLLMARKIIPGVYVVGVGNQSVLTEAKALEKIGQAVPALEEKEQNFDFGILKMTLRPKDLGLSFDPVATARAAYNVGRSGNLLTDLKTEVTTLINGERLNLSYTVDDSVWNSKISEIYKAVLGREATFAYEKDLYIEPGKSGLKTDADGLGHLILAAALGLELEPKITLPTYVPKISTETLQPLYPVVKKLTTARPLVYGNGGQENISESEFLKMLDFKSGSVSANVSTINQFVKSVSAKYNRPAKSLSFEAEGTKVTSFSPGEDGLVVDEESLLESLTREVTAGRGARIAVPVKRTSAEIAGNKYGIKELLGRGESNFAGSIPGRITNIKVASSKINGTLVEPGGEFSFGNAVGDISAATGYDYAYIIKEGRTVLGTGGGVCQVSTTVFRAALNAGLPIVTRTAHAYRVHYYEEGGSPVGLDATVYPPTVDLKFKNDTAGYILITSQVDLAGLNLYFNIYGTSDGRTVKLNGPLISNYSPAPAALYQDDSTLPKGVTKQVDWSAPGSTVIFERIVERGGQVINTDKFISNYRPWQAVYLVGTKE